MSRPYVDRLSDPIRNSFANALMYGPSLGALAVGAGSLSCIAAVSFITAFVAADYMQWKKRDIEYQIASLKLHVDWLKNIVPAEMQHHVQVRHKHKSQRRLQSLQKISEDISKKMNLDKIMPIVVQEDKYPVSTDGCAIYFTPKALRKFNHAEAKFLVAHEVSHIRVGDTNQDLMRLSRTAWKTQPILAAIGGASLASIFNSVGGMEWGIAAVIATVGLRQSQKLVEAFNSRSKERRRDFEALQVTGDLKAARSALVKLEVLKNTKSLGFYERLFSTHPLGLKRIKNIQDAFDDIARPNKRPAPFLVGETLGLGLGLVSYERYTPKS